MSSGADRANMREVSAKTKAARTCPICGKPADPDHLPFCSKRCANVDLNRWLSGTYAIPGAAAPGEDESEGEE